MTRACVAGMNRADPRLGHKGAHLDVLRRQQRDDRVAGGDPFALAVERVENQAGLRRGLLLCVKIPLRLGESLLSWSRTARA